MLRNILFAIAILVSFAGCAIIFIDVLFTHKTDYCQDMTAGEYIGKADGSGANRQSGFFVLAVPEFKYTYEGKNYQGRSANLFFHIFLRKGKLTVPFINGKNYYIYVNPADPTMFITSGEQRITLLHILGCTVTVIGAALLFYVMSIPAV